MKITVLFCALLAIQQTQSCGSSGGPVAMRTVALPDATCNQPYTGQFVTGGVQPYTVTIGQIIDSNGAAVASLSGLAIAQQGGGSMPLKSNTTIPNATGYIVGTFPCTSLTANNTQVLLAGSKLTIRKPLQ